MLAILSLAVALLSQVGLDIAFHGGIEVEDDRLLDSERTEHSARRFARWRWTGRRPASSALIKTNLPANAGWLRKLGVYTHSVLTGVRVKQSGTALLQASQVGMD